MALKMRAAPVRASAPVLISPFDPALLQGVSVAQAVEALGHDIVLDIKSLEQIAALGNAAAKGIKSRFTHPGLSSDGLGKYLGRLRQFRVDYGGNTPTVRADLKIADISRKSPEGDLGGYVLGLASEDPHAFGMSVVISVEPTWVLDTGEEVPVVDEDGMRVRKPDNSMYIHPVARVFELHGADVVDEPAATREGIFSAFSKTTNELSSALYEQIDDALTFYGVSPARAYEFFMAYFQAREVAGNAYALPHTVSAEGLIRLSRTSMEDFNMGEEEVEMLFDEEDRPAQLDFSVYDTLMAQIVAAASAQSPETDERLGRLEQAVADINRNLTILGMAVAGLRGEPTVTAKVGGEQTTRAAARHTMAASRVPVGMIPPPATAPNYADPTEAAFVSGTPLENSLRMTALRNKGGR